MTEGLQIPAFLVRPLTDQEREAARRIRAGMFPGERRAWQMPPPGLTATLRAIKRGHNTFGKLRKSLGRKYTDRQIETALRALRRSGAVTMEGRTYRAI